jgi:hypothetical protein
MQAIIGDKKIETGEYWPDVAGFRAAGLDSPFEPLGLQKGLYTFHYDYPLKGHVDFTHELTPQTRLVDVLELASLDYERIYREEAESMTTDPTPAPGWLNRSPTNGVHGIGMHVIEDLCFEGVRIEGGVVTFDIGS